MSRSRPPAARSSVEPSRTAAGNGGEQLTTDHVYRVTEIVGTSPDGIDPAIRNALARASKTLRNIDWFEVVSVRGHVADGDVAHVQVTMKVGFRLDE